MDFLRLFHSRRRRKKSESKVSADLFNDCSVLIYKGAKCKFVSFSNERYLCLSESFFSLRKRNKNLERTDVPEVRARHFLRFVRQSKNHFVSFLTALLMSALHDALPCRASSASRVIVSRIVSKRLPQNPTKDEIANNPQRESASKPTNICRRKAKPSLSAYASREFFGFL